MKKKLLIEETNNKKTEIEFKNTNFLDRLMNGDMLKVKISYYKKNKGFDVWELRGCRLGSFWQDTGAIWGEFRTFFNKKEEEIIRKSWFKIKEEFEK